MVNADITKYSSIKLDYLFCIIGITLVNADRKKFGTNAVKQIWAITYFTSVLELPNLIAK